MKVCWLGQGGYRITTDNGTVIVIDPYMSDSLLEKEGESYTREVPIDREILQGHVDVLVMTHNHADHMDFGTLDVMMKGDPMQILCPLSVFRSVRSRYGGAHNYIMFESGIETELSGVLFRAVYAAHTDEKAIGVVIVADGQVLVHTGDTMYHRSLPYAYPHRPDALLLPVNGKGCNMNAHDAARLTREVEAKKVFPMHWDMFKAYGCDAAEFTELFTAEDTTEIVIPEYYTDVEI